MKANSRPFKAKQYGICPIGRHVISKGDLIVRLEKRAVWNEERASGGLYGKVCLVQRSSDYAHDKCLNERKDDAQK